MKTALLCLLLAPLLGSFINAFRWRSKNLKSAALIGVLACLTSFGSAGFLFFSLCHLEDSALSLSLFEWLNIGSFKSSFSFLLDPLSVFMLLVITGVGSLIHFFSVYYMSHDDRPAKYFSYLNLFVFSMIVLVSADNLFLMFLGWEGVGLCSYLLIGFWFTDRQKASAGMKAFIVNRIGDLGFLLGMFFLFQQFHSLDFRVLSESLTQGAFDLTNIKWACLFLFMGAVGKSAQIPLYIWLPSAMAGPTPVSALIHAATMVTAGIYLIARLNFMFVLAPEVLTLICWIGLATAFVSALIACAQEDIKKVLAYSTVSQLGYMFLAAGLTAFTASLFHLLTHAFFKALLFLGAGAVIHSLKGEQNIHRMGGLKKSLPGVYICFMLGFLALIGLPPFSGFFSKDEILWSAFAQGRFVLFSFALLTALISTFYMTRLFVLVFYGKNLKPKEVEPPGKNVFAYFPLGVLALLSVFGGFLGLPHLISEYLPFHPPHFIAEYLKPVVAQSSFKGSHFAEACVMIGSTVLVLLVLAITGWFYLERKQKLKALKEKHQSVFDTFHSGLKVDLFCHTKIVKPVLNISYELWQGVDLKLLQGFILLIQRWLLSLRFLFEKLQNGNMQNYILFMVLGLVVCVLSILFN